MDVSNVVGHVLGLNTAWWCSVLAEVSKVFSVAILCGNSYPPTIQPDNGMSPIFDHSRIEHGNSLELSEVYGHFGIEQLNNWISESPTLMASSKL